MNAVQVICLIIAVGLFIGSAVSLIKAVLAKRKRKQDEDNRKESDSDRN